MTRCAFLVGYTFIFFLSGCIGDHFAERALLLEQIQDSRFGGPRFEIDTSRIPPDWIEQHTVEDIRYASHADHIRLDSGHSVKVILVPGEVREQPSTQPTSSEGSQSMPKKVAALVDQMRAELPAFQKRWGAAGTYTFYASINPNGLDTTYTGSMPIGGEQTRLAYEIIAPNNPLRDSDVAVVTIIHEEDSGTNKCQHMPTMWHWENNQWVSADISALNDIDRFVSQFKTVPRNGKSDTKPASGD